jgi:hypothetical protein
MMAQSRASENACSPRHVVVRDALVLPAFPGVVACENHGHR